MSYSNFKDPFGLLKRMLLSGNKVAYSVLKREFTTLLLKPIDYLLKYSEKKQIQKNRKVTKLPIILVLGGSRSGTTLLYQTLVQYLLVSYFSNFIASFERSPLNAFKFFKPLIPKSKTSFRSFFGSVEGFGGPNDGFVFWNRWLGEDRNDVAKEISAVAKADMKRFFNAWLDITKKPFVNKNNRNSLCAPMFAEVFDNVFFIEIYRNPVFVAQSIILSRRTVQGNDKIGWGLLSTDSKKNDDPLAYIDDICNQVHQVNEVIAENRKKIDPKRYFRIAFKDFCENPGAFVKIVGLEALGQNVESKELEELQFSKASNGKRLNDDEFKRIEAFFDELTTSEKRTKENIF
ncbi:sulfotransferase [Zobellia barbeyronii]|uniref:Sulfotransferase n=1 Tax=Zobellia barbeyronii TaxID=2748009 RepID=A0ABS5WA27_9FLAO|nr:sulfotransferase [Zobellia barbeyronii]MBT2160266.1 sulfotransferase [Zobellia barbeyronii]